MLGSRPKSDPGMPEYMQREIVCLERERFMGMNGRTEGIVTVVTAAVILLCLPIVYLGFMFGGAYAVTLAGRVKSAAGDSNVLFTVGSVIGGSVALVAVYGLVRLARRIVQLERK
jgi:hypothetical protein